ncbi:hypothetical protein CCM_03810 [Cordyceps militaris CM01]|uniref:Uncharacterized protein n=1 Tax=Cordyceps militaris (strain CM01) TaxID=983644 RepID=G3JGS3_CORMM|nr:uncharacterized protein CCM_03810 [Cordyceps militaris CM01]EGX92437.1 hypothetical protein CCM_03810 [Cordyceps militaris CM01]
MGFDIEELFETRIPRGGDRQRDCPKPTAPCLGPLAQRDGNHRHVKVPGFLLKPLPGVVALDHSCPFFDIRFDVVGPWNFLQRSALRPKSNEVAATSTRLGSPTSCASPYAARNQIEPNRALNEREPNSGRAQARRLTASSHICAERPRFLALFAP